MPEYDGLQHVAFEADQGFAVGLGLPRQAIATIPVWPLAPLVDQFVERGVQRLVCFSSTSVMGKAGTSTPHERAAVEQERNAEKRL